MPTLKKSLWTLAAAAFILPPFSIHHLQAADKDLLPPRLPKEQRDNLQRFLRQHEKPDRYIPSDAKLVDAQPGAVGESKPAAPGQAIKQYVVQVTSHRPVPGQEDVKRVDVYYYRPNPDKGKPGITVRHTVDLTTGEQVGATEVLVKHPTPLSQEELAEAVELAQEKSPAVAALFKGRDKQSIRWEYLQIMIGRKHETHEPGDRVVRFLFKATAGKDEEAPAPVAVMVNLTKGVVSADPK